MSPVLITGVNRGLGLQLCRLAAKRSIPIIVSSRRGQETEQLLAKEKIPFQSHVNIDFGAEGPDKIYGKVHALGTLAGVIHSSSPYTQQGVRDSKTEDFQMYGNFVCNTLALSKAAAEQVEPGGKAIYVGAIVGQLGRIRYTPFSVYKLSLRGLVEGLNKEGLSATYINLGSVRTDPEAKASPCKYLSETYVAGKFLDALEADSAGEQLDLFSREDLHSF